MSTLISDLESIDVLRSDRLEKYYPRVRDRDDVGVLRDNVTEVIVLSQTEHIDEDYYEEREETGTCKVQNADVQLPRLEDNLRRANDFGGYIRNKRWLDFGCGLGGMLNEMASESAWAAGLEPSKERAVIVAENGHDVVGNISELEDASIDVVTMFHVLEHVTEPISTLKSIRRVLRPSGTLLVEVPHARDVLFTLYDSEAFKKFTFWSEHLVLHTRLSLQALLKASGFSDIEVSGQQRYPLANHLHWLAKQKGGGHDIWRHLVSTGLNAEYEAILSRIDRTDTLIATCWA